MKKGSFPLDDSKAADEGLGVLKNGRREKGSFPLNESKAADEEFFVLKRERALKKEAFRWTNRRQLMKSFFY